MWQLLTAGLLGALLSGAGAWVTVSRMVVDQKGIVDLIETRSPYLEDRRLLLDRTERTRKIVNNVQSDIAQLQVDSAKSLALLEAIDRRLDEEHRD